MAGINSKSSISIPVKKVQKCLFNNKKRQDLTAKNQIVGPISWFLDNFVVEYDTDLLEKLKQTSDTKETPKEKTIANAFKILQNQTDEERSLQSNLNLVSVYNSLRIPGGADKRPFEKPKHNTYQPRVVQHLPKAMNSTKTCDSTKKEEKPQSETCKKEKPQSETHKKEKRKREKKKSTSGCCCNLEGFNSADRNHIKNLNLEIQQLREDLNKMKGNCEEREELAYHQQIQNRLQLLMDFMHEIKAKSPASSRSNISCESTPYPENLERIHYYASHQEAVLAKQQSKNIETDSMNLSKCDTFERQHLFDNKCRTQPIVDKQVKEKLKLKIKEEIKKCSDLIQNGTARVLESSASMPKERLCVNGNQMLQKSQSVPKEHLSNYKSKPIENCACKNSLLKKDQSSSLKEERSCSKKTKETIQKKHQISQTTSICPICKISRETQCDHHECQSLAVQVSLSAIFEEIKLRHKQNQTTQTQFPEKLPAPQPICVSNKSVNSKTSIQSDPNEPKMIYIRKTAHSDALMADSSFCIFCTSANVPVIRTELMKEVKKICFGENLDDIALTIVLQDNDIYHINLSLMQTGTSLGCIYATQRCIDEATDDNVFEQFVTFFVVDSRHNNEKRKQICSYTFELLKE